jgi:CRP/FNR family transcriptional regulator
MAQHEETKIIRRFFNMGQPQTFGKGEIILGNDAEPDGVYYLSDGYVKAFSISDNGDEFLHIIFGHDELFPMMWAYTGESSQSVYYQTLSNAVTWRISREWFTTLVSTNPSLCFALSIQMARQFQVFVDRVENLEYKKASERVAYRLLFLASRFGIRTGEKIIIDTPITHETLANTINLTRETVSRQIEKLEREHIVRTAPRHFTIMDIPALMNKISRPNNIKNWGL